MKNALLILVAGLVVAVVSSAYARRGSSSVFTFAVHPLAGYADQIFNDDYAGAPEDMPLDMGSDSLLDDPSE